MIPCNLTLASETTLALACSVISIQFDVPQLMNQPTFDHLVVPACSVRHAAGFLSGHPEEIEANEIHNFLCSVHHYRDRCITLMWSNQQSSSHGPGYLCQLEALLV